MSLIIYWPSWKENKPSGPWLDSIMHIASPQEVHYCPSFAAFSQQLRRQLYDVRVIMLVPEDRADLEEILLLRDILQDRQIVFILPNDDEEMAARAHVLRPRFVTWQGSDFSSLSSILKRMLRIDDAVQAAW